MKRVMIAVLLGALALSACGRIETGNSVAEEEPTTVNATDEGSVAENVTEVNASEETAAAENSTKANATEEVPSAGSATKANTAEEADAPQLRTFSVSPADDDYDISFLGYDEEENPLGSFPAHVHVTLSEAADGVDAGKKRVTAVFAMDVSENPGPIYGNWVSAFDEHTHISFETASEQNVYSADETLTQLYEFTFESDGVPVTVSMRISTENNYPDMTDTVEVICPADYDGTVFMIGYLSDEEYQALADYDFAGRTYTIDELPNSAEEMLYFRVE